uniref:hypothetical protein n=1 Tax=Brotaphodocola sp. TaxID=3073577 RepID=UPI003D7E2A6C
TWRVILVSSADIFLSKSLRILAERITQKGIVSPPEKVCDTPTYRGGGTSTLSYSSFWMVAEILPASVAGDFDEFGESVRREPIEFCPYAFAIFV